MPVCGRHNALARAGPRRPPARPTPHTTTQPALSLDPRHDPVHDHARAQAPPQRAAPDAHAALHCPGLPPNHLLRRLQPLVDGDGQLVLVMMTVTPTAGRRRGGVGWGGVGRWRFLPWRCTTHHHTASGHGHSSTYALYEYCGAVLPACLHPILPTAGVPSSTRTGGPEGQ